MTRYGIMHMSYFFLIDQTSHVVKTNYCTLYKQPVNKDRTCFGEIFTMLICQRAGKL